MKNPLRSLMAIELKQVSGGETTLVNRKDGLHVYMTEKNEKFEFNEIVFRPDGSASNKYESSKSAYHYEIIEKMLDGNGQFHARIWK